MSTDQIPFDLPVVPSQRRGDFFVSEANAMAHATLRAPESWPGGRMVLVGPEGAGKSHLAALFAEETGADLLSPDDLDTAEPDRLAQGPIALDDADRVAGQADREAKLFHLYNLLAAHGHLLLLTARRPPSRWKLGLPDLASRLESVAVTRIEAPDDKLLSALLLKHFADRQLDVPANVVTYLVARMDRSAKAAGDLVARLDRAALAQKRPITRDLARQVLAP